MPQIRGSQVVVALYDETTYGADPGTPDGTKCKFSSCTLKPAREYVDDPILASGRGKHRRTPGNKSIAGDIVTTLSPTNINFWLRHLLGAPTGSGTNASPYVYVPKDLPVGFAVEYDWRSAVASRVERDHGCKINSGSFALNQAGFLEFTASIMGKSRTTHATPLDATLTDPVHEAWRGCGGVVKVGGTQVGGFLSGSVTVDNALDGSLYTFPAVGETACERGSLPEDAASISCSLELVFQDFTLLDLAKNGTETSVEWAYTNAAGDLLSVLLDHVDIDETAPTIETMGGIKLSLSGVGFQSGTDLGLKVTYKPHA